MRRVGALRTTRAEVDRGGLGSRQSNEAKDAPEHGEADLFAGIGRTSSGHRRAVESFGVLPGVILASGLADVASPL